MRLLRGRGYLYSDGDAMILSDLIPNHPKTCKGVKSSVWTSVDDQCHLCWLATYDPRYRRLWNIPAKGGGRFGIEPSTLTGKSPEELYRCVHRGTDRISTQGCGGCQGVSALFPCNNEHTGVSRCLPSGTPSQESTVRSNGHRVCRECGFRTPEKDLEIPVPKLRSLLETGGQLPENWQHTRSARLAILEMLVEFLGEKRKPPVNLSGRGVVTVAGGPKYFPLAFCMIRCLRDLGCRLPVQIWHLGPSEIDSSIVSICSSYDIELRDVLSLPEKLRVPGGWQAKISAIKHSPFEEVLFLDADCFPVVDPSFLFDCRDYETHGALFWQDIVHPRKSVHLNLSPDIWDRIGMRPRSEPAFESGQLLIHKRRCWKEILVTKWFNDYSDYWYSHIYGDKDTFHLAWRACGTEYGLSPSPDWSSPYINQKSPDGSLLFQHACQGKNQILSGRLSENTCDTLRTLLPSALIDLKRLISVLTASGTESMLSFPMEDICRESRLPICSNR